MSAPQVCKPTNTCAPYSSSFPSPEVKCPSSLQTPPSLSICSGSPQPVSRPGLFSHFLTIGLFSSAYYSTLRKTFPSLHTLCQLFLLFEILFQGQISLETSSMLHLPFSHSKTISALTMSGVLPRPPCCGIH